MKPKSYSIAAVGCDIGKFDRVTRDEFDVGLSALWSWLFPWFVDFRPVAPPPIDFTKSARTVLNFGDSSRPFVLATL